MPNIKEEIWGHRRFYTALIGVFILATVVRLWGLGDTPFVADEFLDVNATYGYHKTGVWQAWDFNHADVNVRDNQASDERAWLYRIQVAALYDYLEPTETTVRLVSALWGILTAIILYFITFSFTKNRWIALIAAFLWAVSVPAIELNRKVRMYSMFAPMFLLFSWSLFQFIDAKKKCVCSGVSCSLVKISKGIFNLHWFYLIPVTFFGALSYHLHPLTGNIVLVLFVYFVVMAIFNRTEAVVRRYSAYALIMVVGAVAAALFLPSIWDQFASSLVFFEDHWSYVGHILRNYWHPLIGGAMILLGSWFLIKKQKDERSGAWIVSTFFTILFASMFLWSRNVGPQYIFFIQPFGLILAAAGIYCVAKLLETHISYAKTFIVAVVASFVFLPFYGYFFLENNTYHITSEGDQANYRKVFDYVKRNASPEDVMITRNFRNYYWSGLDIPVFDFGSERSEEELVDEGKVSKITLENMESVVSKHPSGWVVFSDNDTKFITKEARVYFDEHFEKVTDSSLVRGKVSVYRWGNTN
jgi:hypothetical protein